MSRKRSFKSGFTISELLMSLLILVIFFALAGELFNSSVLLSAAGEKLSNNSSRTDSALFQLRADVWNAKTISVSSAQSVDLSLADGTQVSWKIDPDQGVIRTVIEGSPEHWET